MEKHRSSTYIFVHDSGPESQRAVKAVQKFSDPDEMIVALDADRVECSDPLPFPVPYIIAGWGVTVGAEQIEKLISDLT